MLSQKHLTEQFCHQGPKPHPLLTTKSPKSRRGMLDLGEEERMIRHQTTGEEVPEHNPQVDLTANVSPECERGMVVEEKLMTHPMIGERLQEHIPLLEPRAETNLECQRDMMELVEEESLMTHQMTGEKLQEYYPMKEVRTLSHYITIISLDYCSSHVIHSITVVVINYLNIMFQMIDPTIVTTESPMIETTIGATEVPVIIMRDKDLTCYQEQNLKQQQIKKRKRNKVKDLPFLVKPSQ